MCRCVYAMCFEKFGRPIIGNSQLSQFFVNFNCLFCHCAGLATCRFGDDAVCGLCVFCEGADRSLDQLILCAVRM